jgi:hypothetical protein
MCRILFIAVFVAGHDSRDLLSTRASGAKVGMISKKLNNARTKLAHDNGMEWFYNWDARMETGPNVVTNANGLEYIPQQWAPDKPKPVKPSGATQPILLMYNEPDNSGQSAMCYENGVLSRNAAIKMGEEYCDQIQNQFQELGYAEFATPAWSQNPDPAIPADKHYIDTCVMPFFDTVARDSKCKAATKYFAWHTYTACDSRAGIANFCTDIAAQWTGVMQTVENNYGFAFTGMYVTEFAGWWQNCGTGEKGITGQALVAEVCSPILKNSPRMSRIAWFSDFDKNQGGGNSDLFNPDNTLSPIGQAYLKAVGTLHDDAETAGHDAAEKASQDATEVASQDATEAASQDAAEKASQDAAEKAGQDATEAASQEATEAASQDATEKASQDATEKASQDATEAASQDVSEKESQDSTKMEGQDSTTSTVIV